MINYSRTVPSSEYEGKKEEAAVAIGLQVQETPLPADHVKDWTPVMRYIKRVWGWGCNSVGKHMHNTLKKKSLLIRPQQVCQMPACPLFPSLPISQSLIRASQTRQMDPAFLNTPEIEMYRYGGGQGGKAYERCPYTNLTVWTCS